MRPATLLLSFVGIASAVALGVWASSSAKASSPPAMSDTQCTTILKGVSQPVALGLMEALAAVPELQGAVDEEKVLTDPVLRQKVADTAANYLASHGYPNVAGCVRRNPLLLDAINVPDCTKIFDAVPSDHANAVRDQLQRQGIAVPDPFATGGIAGPANKAVYVALGKAAGDAYDSIGEHAAAQCARAEPAIFAIWYGTKYGDTPPTEWVDCRSIMMGLPTDVQAAALAVARMDAINGGYDVSHPGANTQRAANVVAQFLAAQGYPNAADCLRNDVTLLPLTIGA